MLAAGVFTQLQENHLLKKATAGMGRTANAGSPMSSRACRTIQPSASTSSLWGWKRQRLQRPSRLGRALRSAAPPPGKHTNPAQRKSALPFWPVHWASAQDPKQMWRRCRSRSSCRPAEATASAASAGTAQATSSAYRRTRFMVHPRRLELRCDGLSACDLSQSINHPVETHTSRMIASYLQQFRAHHRDGSSQISGFLPGGCGAPGDRVSPRTMIASSRAGSGLLTEPS